MGRPRYCLVFALLFTAYPVLGAEVLYNGIRLPVPWPPKAGATNHEPMRIPYLESPPDVIPVDVGRQLFVDDFLVKETTLKRTFHQAKYVAQCPVLKPDTPWENATKDPTAMPFSDGVWYDPQDCLFKMWYMGGYMAATCYATSKDGISWEKPELDAVSGTNIVLEETTNPKKLDSSVVWLDLEEADPAKRFKFFLVRKWPRGGWGGFLYTSSDGIHWGEAVANTGRLDGDRSTVFYNPFRKLWVYSIRSRIPEDPRWRRYYETPDLIADSKNAGVESGKPVLWVGADKNDPPREDIKGQPQLYNLDAVAYESLMLGLFTIWPGQPKDRAKPNYVCLGFSRDGFHWARPDHRPFADVSERYGDWNWGNVQSVGGGCLIVGDKLYFYVSARAGVKGSVDSGVCSTGLAVLRRDGFASMGAEEEGTLTTRTVRFKGKHLFVNVAAADGELRVEALGKNGKTLPAFSKENCLPMHVDATLQPVKWKGVEDLAQLSGEPVAFRFHLKKGQLYAFWISDDPSGASRGYVAAGGPGFTSSRDMVGPAAYEAASQLNHALQGK